MVILLLLLRRVMVSDVNDNVPKVEIPEGCATVSEFHDLRESIVFIKTKDGDNPLSPNGRTIIRLIDGNELGFFSTLFYYFYFLRCLPDTYYYEFIYHCTLRIIFALSDRLLK
jgi:hypothetical protein